MAGALIHCNPVLRAAACCVLVAAVAVTAYGFRPGGSEAIAGIATPTPTPTFKPPLSCVVNPGPNQVKVTIQHPPGANPQAEAQLQSDAQRVQQACQLASNGSQRFRQAVKNIGPFIIHVERTAGIGFGVEGPPGGGITDGTNAPGIGTSIDVGDHERTTMTGGDQANRDAVRAATLLYTLVHEIIGEELPGHDHTTINNDVITVVRDQLGIQVTQLGDCKPKTIGGTPVQVFNWSLMKPTPTPGGTPVTPAGAVHIQENITVANADGARLLGCPAGVPVGGVADLPGVDASGGPSLWALSAATLALAVIAGLGLSRWLRRRADC
jgi:hypothetical protein